ncbi:MAG: Crp/Fnr family transcriptional regulator [Clostridia bacterium]|nr:Crp/Fnr family transcriptional regulator [Clostridia bacterium]
MDYLDLILETPILSPFSPEEIKDFLETGKLKLVTYKKHAVIHFDGEVCNRVEVVIQGKVSVERIDMEGNLLTISEFQEGDILGGNVLFSSHPVYPMTVSAKEDAVVVEISKGVIFEWLTSNALFLRAYLEFVSDLTTILANKIRNTIQLPLRDKILNFLRGEVEVQGSFTIVLRQTKKALAEQLGVQRTSLSRELKKMSDEGLIRLDHKKITLLS